MLAIAKQQAANTLSSEDSNKPQMSSNPPTKLRTLKLKKNTSIYSKPVLIYIEALKSKKVYRKLKNSTISPEFSAFLMQGLSAQAALAWTFSELFFNNDHNKRTPKD